MIWEYKTHIDDYHIGSFKLSEYGKEGWELVSHSVIKAGFGNTHYYTFKRPKN